MLPSPNKIKHSSHIPQLNLRRAIQEAREFNGFNHNIIGTLNLELNNVRENSQTNWFSKIYVVD